MQVVVRYFAALREATGCDDETLDLPDGATVADSRALVAARHPSVTALLARCAAARNRSFASENDILAEDDEIVFLPPMAGGAIR